MKIQNLKKISIFNNENLKSLKILQEQGYCNKNYLLKTSKNRYIIRVLNNSSKFNRKEEFIIQNNAYKVNLASKILYFQNNIMIYKYINGKHLKKLNKKYLKLLAKKITLIHKIKVKVQTHDFNNDLNEFKNKLSSNKYLQTFKKFKKQIKKLNKFKKDIVLCHHDLNIKNLLFTKNNLKFIDWEFARKNDKYFDIASICIEFELNKKSEDKFLKYYFKTINTKTLKKLKIYKKIYKYQRELWFEIYGNNLA